MVAEIRSDHPSVWIWTVRVWLQLINRHPAKPAVPVLKLSLRDAMDAAVDQNPTVRLFKERITQAQDVADTQLGELLPNLSGTA